MNHNHTRLAFWTASSFIAISIGMIVYTFYADKDNEEREKNERTEYTRFIRSNLFSIRIFSIIILLWALMSVAVLRYRSRKGILLLNALLTVIMYVASIILFIKQTNTLITHRNNKQIAKDAGLYLGFSLIANILALGYYIYFIYPAMRHISNMSKA